jgi:hypothetical protein
MMKILVTGMVCALAVLFLATPFLAAQAIPHAPLGVVSDWAHRHVLYPDSKDDSVMKRLRGDPRWLQSWYLRHREVWWPQRWSGWGSRPGTNSHRDWSVSLSATPATASFEPQFDFSYAIGLDTGYGSLTTTDIGSGQFLATAGTLTVTGTLTGSPASGTSFPLYPGGPTQTTSPSGKFLYDNVLYPSAAPLIDNNGLLFVGSSYEVNIWSDGADVYEFDDEISGGYTNDVQGAPFMLNMAPGGGETYPAKFVFDVTAAPSCSNDYVVIGVPATPASGGQANIVGVNNLYSGSSGALCSTGPTVMFAYASGTGQVPAAVGISQNGTQLAYIENLATGSSYFHVLTIGTTGTNGASATAAAVPGSAGGNNAVDQTVLLSPDGGVTTQSSSNAPWVVYTHGDANDVAYATTYSTATNSGYLYKIANVFNGAAPTIAWSVAIDAIPSTPVYDSVSNKIFFTDSNGSIDYVVDSGALPSVVYGTVLASGATSENPVVVDSVNEMVYATFNSNGTNALVVQAPTSMESAVSVPVGTASTIYGSPYAPDFNNAWYTGSGKPFLYIAGTGSGSIPTLYRVGFVAGGVLNSSADVTTAALSSGTADSSPVTEFYNATLGKDYLFVGVTDNCVATTEGGTGGCVMSLDLTSGSFPLVNASTTALAAAGGTSGIIVDNDNSATEASSIYYATKTGATLVKATQSGLN